MRPALPLVLAALVAAALAGCDGEDRNPEREALMMGLRGSWTGRMEPVYPYAWLDDPPRIQFWYCPATRARPDALCYMGTGKDGAALGGLAVVHVVDAATARVVYEPMAGQRTLPPDLARRSGRNLVLRVDAPGAPERVYTPPLV